MNMKQILVKAFQKVWRTWFRDEGNVKPVMCEEKPKDVTKRILRFFEKRFDFRYNQLTGVTEYRPKGATGESFHPIDEREMNGLIIEARLEGIYCWNSQVQTWVLSNKVKAYHPFHLYMKELPDWDGTDRVTPFLKRVSDEEWWLHDARCWLRAMTDQWMGKMRTHANALMPVLMSREQGMGKSTFCRLLLPDSLQAYYLDHLNLSPGASPEKKIVNNGLINLDEFDKISEKRQPDLKNLLQMLSVSVYRGKRLGYITEPRLASFIATTNSLRFLTDPTGSRRFLCVEVKRYIPDMPLEHKQFYAQLKWELSEGLPDFLNKEEEAALQRRNKKYYRESMLEDVFHACFRLPDETHKGEWMTAAEMFKVMVKHNASALRGITAKQLSYRLRGLGLLPRHTEYGNVYQVVKQGTSA